MNPRKVLLSKCTWFLYTSGLWRMCSVSRRGLKLTHEILAGVDLPHWNSARRPAELWPGPGLRLSPTGRRKPAQDQCCPPGSLTPETGGRRCGRPTCHPC